MNEEPAAVLSSGGNRVGPPTASISDEIDAIKKDVYRAITLAEDDQLKAGFSRVDPNLPEIMQELRVIASKDPKEMASRLSKLLGRFDKENLQFEGHSVPLMPPVLFHRVPKLSAPLVNREAIEEAVLADTESAGLEGFLDNMFSNDRIYDDVIRKLRAQIIALDQRNSVLESNLDLADSEISYWRNCYKQDKPLRATSPPMTTKRVISEKTWKLSISKFIGSADQFTLIKALFQWKLAVHRKKNTSNFSS